jgi:hypothetical protein
MRTPGPGEPGEIAVELAALVFPADPHADAALGRGDERILHRGVAHLFAVDAQAPGRTVDDGEQLFLRIGG